MNSLFKMADEAGAAFDADDVCFGAVEQPDIAASKSPSVVMVMDRIGFIG